MKKTEYEYANPPKNKALAGVGNPKKLVVWRSSMLNFAKRSAEKTGMINPINGSQSGTFTSVHPISATTTAPGANPKLIMSASESSCLPISE
jgi:hypothetical protein